MKRIMSISVALIIAILFMNSCGKSLTENKYLGVIPGKAQNFNEEREKLLDNETKAKDGEQRRELQEKRSELGREWNDWLHEYASAGGLQPTIPHEVEGDFPYTVNEVSLAVNRSVIELLFSLTTVEDFQHSIPRQRIRLFFVGLDSEKNPIVLSALPAAMYEVREDLPAGSEVTLKGVWNRDHLQFLEDLDMILIISGEKYDELDREKSRARRS